MNIYAYIKDMDRFENSDYNIPLVRFLGKPSVLLLSIKRLLGWDKPGFIRERGFRSFDFPWSNELDELSENRFYHAEMDSFNVHLFNKFIVECENIGIKIIMIYPPEFINGQKEVINRDEILEFYNSLAKKHRLEFLDYSQDEICLNKEYFFDYIHLNKAGAELFTDKLIDDLKSMDLKH
jgi:hypothetical protein